MGAYSKTGLEDGKGVANAPQSMHDLKHLEAKRKFGDGLQCSYS